MDALLSVYGDGRTEHDDGLAALAPASGVELVVGGASGGGRWPSNGGRVSCGRARGGRRARGVRRAWRRVAGDDRAARWEDGRASGLAQLRRAQRAAQQREGQWRSGELRPRSRWEARRAAGGGRWSGSALQGRAGEQTGVASAGVAGSGGLRPRSRRATEAHTW